MTHTPNIFVGIDFGYRGGAVVLLRQGRTVIRDLPVRPSGGVLEKDLLAALHDERATHVTIEQPYAAPRLTKPALIQVGQVLGQIVACSRLAGADVALVQPYTWRSYFNVVGKQDKLAATAAGLFPEHRGLLSSKTNVKYAKALLLARFRKDRVDATEAADAGQA